MKAFPEQYRQTPGYFKIPHLDLPDTWFLCTASDGPEWEHVAVALYRIRRCPTWEEMCWIKDLFWEEEMPVLQLHPARSEWVSNHPYALHLWRPVHTQIPLPPSKMVGIKSVRL